MNQNCPQCESGKCERFFVRKDALFALITVAEKHEIEKGGYAI